MIFFKHFLIFLVFLDFIFSENSENISKTFNETNQQDKIDGINDYLIRLKEIERFIIINERKLAEISKFRMTFLDMKSPHLFTSHDSDIPKEKNSNAQSFSFPKQEQNINIAFYNKLIKKNSFMTEKKIQNFQICADRKGSSESNIYLSVIFQQNDSLISIYDLAGNAFLEDFDTGHRIHRMTFFNMGDEALIGTLGDDNKLRIISLVFNQKKSSKKNVEISKEINIGKTETIDFSDYLDYQLITELFFHMSKGTKFIIFGDKIGDVKIFTRNGTFKGSVNLGDEIVGLVRHHLYLIFATKSSLGFLTIAKELFLAKCDEVRIKQIESDQITNNIVYILSENQEILIYEIKGSNSCKRIQTLASNLPQNQTSNSKIYVSKNYVYYQSSEQSQTLRVFNVSDISYESGDYENFEIELHTKRLSNSSSLDYNFYKNSQNSFFIVVKETEPSGSKIEITSYELLTPTKKGSDFLSYIRGPLIVLSILGILLYQIFFRKKKEEKLNNVRGNKGFGNKKGVGGMSEEEKKKLRKYEDTFKNLSEKTNELTKTIEKIKTDTGNLSGLEETVKSYKKIL